MNGNPTTVHKLINLLSQYPPEAEIRIAHQPQWPFEYSVCGVIANSELKPTSKYERTSTGLPVVWIVEGQFIGDISIEVWVESAKKKLGQS